MFVTPFSWPSTILCCNAVGSSAHGIAEAEAHKDMALASLGALIAMLVTYAINRSLQRDFASEWAESLRVKTPHPLGEDAIARMLENRGPGQ
jgi:hypothetical protein